MEREPIDHPTDDAPALVMPSLDELRAMAFEGCAEALDGCTVEPDGTCEHGSPSWLLALGMI